MNDINAEHDGCGNKLVGRALAHETSSSVIVNTQSPCHVLVVAGLDDVVVVNTPSGTLVCRMSDISKVKSLVPEVCAVLESVK